MESIFGPTEFIALEQESMLKALSCAMASRTATYVSGPITTGRRFFEWYVREGSRYEDVPNAYKSRLRSAVITPNEDDILCVASEQRASKSGIVIEPASLRMAHWGQVNYSVFWTRIIEQYVARMVVVDGWQYSVGCAAEFADARRLDVPIEDQHGRPLSYDGARRLIQEAVDKLRGQFPDSETIEKTISSLCSFVN